MSGVRQHALHGDPARPLGLVPPAPALTAVACLLIAANLRPSITVVGPLLGDIRASTGMSATVAGLLTTLPLLAFAGISPLTAAVARRLGMERVLMLALAALAAGTLLRSAGPVAALLAGTVVLGAAIAAGNVLLPALVKRDFPGRTGLMTGLYSTTLAATGALASGVAVLLARDLGLGWRGALAVWALLAVVTLALYGRRVPRTRPAPDTGAPIRLRRSWLAWQVTVFMGMMSALFYGLVTWLPALLEDEGMSASGAGVMLGVMQLVSLVTTIGVPILAGRRPSQRRLVVASAGASLTALAGLWATGAAVPLLWIVPLGLGTGGLFGLALMFLVLRAPDARHTSALSGMAQSVGYLLAAVAPVGVGFLHDVTGSWDLPLIALGLAAVAALVTGLGAARDAHVG